jgi:hypothetical protein
MSQVFKKQKLAPNKNNKAVMSKDTRLACATQAKHAECELLLVVYACWPK